MGFMDGGRKKKGPGIRRIVGVAVVMAIFIGGIFAGRGLWLMRQDVKQKEGNDESSGNIDIAEKNENTNDVQQEADTSSQNLTGGDLFAGFYEQAEILLQGMTLEEKVGQMFLVRFPTSGVLEEIGQENPGGYILFGRDFKNETKDSIRNKLQECQNASKIKLVLGVDEEGGTVVRVSAYEAFRSSRFPSLQQLWEKGQLPLILEDAKEKSSLLKSIGLNMNLAPVVDVPANTASFIYDRSYGRGAEETSEYAEELIKTMNGDGMISVMKHFPGYGDNGDTHTGIAVDERDYALFESSDFLPFRSGIRAGGRKCCPAGHDFRGPDRLCGKEDSGMEVSI